MILTPSEADTLLAGLALETLELARMERLEPHDWQQRQAQANVVAFVRGLLMDAEAAKGAAA